MKSRTDSEMLELIMGFAREDERVRGVLLNGSRVNPVVTPDIFQDWDVVFMVSDLAPFCMHETVLPRFGRTLIVQEPDAGEDTDRYAYLIQFQDGNRIDLIFRPLEALDQALDDSLTTVLLDKDGFVPELPQPSEKSYIPDPPSAKEYDDCVNEFYFGLGSQIPKTLWRDELPLTMFFIEVCLRRMLLKMYAWQHQSRSIGKAGRYLRELLPEKDWREYEKTYALAEIDMVWDSLHAFYRQFRQAGEAVGKQNGHRFPEEQAVDVLRHLNHVRNLPPEATSIY